MLHRVHWNTQFLFSTAKDCDCACNFFKLPFCLTISAQLLFRNKKKLSKCFKPYLWQLIFSVIGWDSEARGYGWEHKARTQLTLSRAKNKRVTCWKRETYMLVLNRHKHNTGESNQWHVARSQVMWGLMGSVVWNCLGSILCWCDSRLTKTKKIIKPKSVLNLYACKLFEYLRNKSLPLYLFIGE